MSGRVFVDTNVFVYLFASDEPDKQTTARGVLVRAAGETRLVVSTQVLQEFYVSVTRKLAQPLPPSQAVEATRRLAAYQVIQVDPPMIFRAIAASQQEKVSFWDALIIRAALESGCELLLSEDLQHGRRLESLRIENPFR
jgi:predicted nucleic acid-binding protein